MVAPLDVLQLYGYEHVLHIFKAILAHPVDTSTTSSKHRWYLVMLCNTYSLTYWLYYDAWSCITSMTYLQLSPYMYQYCMSDRACTCTCSSINVVLWDIKEPVALDNHNCILWWPWRLPLANVPSRPLNIPSQPIKHSLATHQTFPRNPSNIPSWPI